MVGFFCLNDYATGELAVKKRLEMRLWTTTLNRAASEQTRDGPSLFASPKENRNDMLGGSFSTHDISTNTRFHIMRLTLLES